MSNLETVKAIYEAFGKGDIEFIMSQLSENPVWDEWTTENSAQQADVPWLRKQIGREAVADFFQIVETLEIYQFDVLSLMEGVNQVASEVKIGSKYFVDEVIHLWTFDDEGKVARFRHYIDTAKHIAATEKAKSSTAA